MKKNSRMYFSNIVVLLLLLYLITILINGYDMAVLNQKADSETVLPVILALQISSDYEPETIKSTGCYCKKQSVQENWRKESINRNGDQNKKKEMPEVRNFLRLAGNSEMNFRPAGVCGKKQTKFMKRQ